MEQTRPPTEGDLVETPPPRPRHAHRVLPTRHGRLVAALTVVLIMVAGTTLALTRPWANSTAAPPPSATLSASRPASPSPTSPPSPTPKPSPTPGPTPPAEPPNAHLAAAVAAAAAAGAQFAGVPTGIAAVPCGQSYDAVVAAGEWVCGHAWSTSKVPLSIAALDQSTTDITRDLVTQAITISDNAAAQALWDGCGGGEVAAAAVEAVLRSGGDFTTWVQPTKTRPEYTAFGQTEWCLKDAAVFMANFPQSASAAYVWEQMGNLVSDQRLGLGHFEGAHFKGGWGPETDGYLVRQIGQVTVGGQCTAVALALTAPTFNQGTQALTIMAETLRDYVS